MPGAIVVARSLNNVIGNGSEIPWRVKGEQKRFKDITMGGALIMGRKTFESIGRPLPGRETIIITRNAAYQREDCTVVHDLDSAIAVAVELDKPAYVVGGGEIYRLALDVVDAVHISTINIEVEGDIYFPEFPTDHFRLVSEESVESNLDYVYQYYERINR